MCSEMRSGIYVREYIFSSFAFHPWWGGVFSIFERKNEKSDDNLCFLYILLENSFIFPHSAHKTLKKITLHSNILYLLSGSFF